MACAMVAVHWPQGDRTFHYDDFHSIVHNPHIQTLDSIPLFFVDPARFSLDEKQAMYRPVVLTSYAINYALGGLDVRGFRALNIAIHIVNALLLLHLVSRLYPSPTLAWSTSLFFAFHPLAVETVHYISSRSESLMALGALVALWAYVRWSEKRSGGLLYLCSVLAFGFSLLSKSVGCVVLVLMPLCDWLLGRPVLERMRMQVVHWVIFGLYLFLSQQIVGKALGSPVRSYGEQLWTQVKASIYYVWLAFMPADLNVEHQFFVSEAPSDAAVLLAGLCALSLGLVVLLRASRPAIFGLAWWTVALIPASAVPLIVLVNEHRLYLALVGGGLLWGGIVERLGKHRARVALITLPVYTMILALLAAGRADVWRDELSLWSDAASKAPAMLKPHLRLGDALVDRGQWKGAEEAYLHALGLRPSHPAAGNNLGRLYVRQGRFAEAEAQFHHVLSVSPDVLQARLNLASLQLRTGRWEEAEMAYKEALLRGDSVGEAQKKLGYIALQYRRDPQSAVRYYRKGVLRAPDAGTWTALGVALRALGEYEEAEAAYHSALALDGTSADAWFNLANLYRDTGREERARSAYRRVGDSAVEPLASKALEQLHLLTPQ